MRLIIENMDKYNIKPYKENSEKTFAKEHAYLRAEKRLKELKGYYWHLFWYLAVNIFISSSKIYRNMHNGETFSEAFFDFGTFAVWIFWGIGMLFHTMGMFGKNLIFGKAWEERKIKEYMQKDSQDFSRYK